MFYLLYTTQNPKNQEFKTVLLFNRATKLIHTMPVNQSLMDFSLNHTIKIFHDPSLDVLVYTKKNRGGEVIYTVKVFQKGNQENLLENSYFIRDLKSTHIF